MSEYFPEPKSFGRKKKGKLNLSNYAAKKDLKNAADVDTSKFGKTFELPNLKFDEDKLDIAKLKNILINLNNLKSKIDKLDINKLDTVPVDLSKLRDVVKMILLKKT